MKISTVRLMNFKCFENQEFSFGSRFNLIIGDNATGKTTLLDGLAVGLGSLFLGMPDPASPRSFQRDEARLAFYRHGDGDSSLDTTTICPEGAKQISPGQRPGNRGTLPESALKGRHKEGSPGQPCVALSGRRVRWATESRGVAPGWYASAPSGQRSAQGAPQSGGVQRGVSGDVRTAEPRYPIRITCTGEVAGHYGEWSRAVTKRDGRTMRYEAAWIRHEAEHLTERVRLGEPVVLPVISYYGTGRLWMQLRQREIETLKPDTRFMGYLDCLNPASDVKRLLAWFKTQEIVALQRGVPSTTLEAARRAILNCVADAQHIGFDVARDELMIRFGDHSLPFRYLSDGYRNMVAMAADIAIRCATLNPQLGEDAARDTPGVVLIDEVDLHLHPRWQRRVVDDLLRAFPNVQFFGTTHSPFIIQSLRPIEGVLLVNLDNPQAGDFTNKSAEDITEEVQAVPLPQRSKRFPDMIEAVGSRTR